MTVAATRDQHLLNTLRARPDELEMFALVDDTSHLSLERKQHWHKVLSSVISTEAIEGIMIEPMLKGAASDAAASAYLAAQGVDEQRHGKLISDYLSASFALGVKPRSKVSRLIYERLTPAFVTQFEQTPIVGYALAHCFERFSLAFYPELRRIAQNDRLPSLLALITSIEKDERRHVVGMRTLVRIELAKRRFTIAQRASLAAGLATLYFDMSLAPWALHNRQFKQHMLGLGVDRYRLRQALRASIRETWALFG